MRAFSQSKTTWRSVGVVGSMESRMFAMLADAAAMFEQSLECEPPSDNVSVRAVGDENRVAGVAGSVVHLHMAEPCLRQQPKGTLLAPAGPEPGSAFSEGYRHAVQQTDGVRHWRDWVSDVVLEVAGDARLVHEERATRLQDRLD